MDEEFEQPKQQRSSNNQSNTTSINRPTQLQSIQIQLQQRKFIESK